LSETVTLPSALVTDDPVTAPAGLAELAEAATIPVAATMVTMIPISDTDAANTRVARLADPPDRRRSRLSRAMTP
jgi:hypothetical protein